MKRTLIAFLLAAALPLAAQQQQPQRTPARPLAPGEPDVVVDIPTVHVDNIALDVQNVNAHVALDARVGNLVQLNAGADVGINRVKLEIVGVDAEVYLVVRLDRVADIIERTLDTIDKNPEIVNRLLTSVDRTVGTVGQVANTALQPGGVVSQAVGTVGRTLENVTAPNGVLSQTVNTLGQTVVRTIDNAGNLVERTVDSTGKLIGDKTVGRLLDLPVVNQTQNAAGQIVKQVRDTSGNLIQITLDRSGKIINSRIVGRQP